MNSTSTICQMKSEGWLMFAEYGLLQTCNIELISGPLDNPYTWKGLLADI